MSITDDIVEKLNALPPDKRVKVLDFVEFLGRECDGAVTSPWKGLQGAFAHKQVDLSAEEIDEARREMWGAWVESDG